MNTILQLPPEGQDGALAALQEEWEIRREVQPGRRREWFDTFDWRLHGRGLRLWTESTAGGEARLSLENDEGAESWDGVAPPDFVPPALAPIVAMRRLLPLVAVRLQGEQVRLLDSRRKTVVRLHLEEGTVEGGDAIPNLIRVEPLKGYGTEAEAVTARLEALGAVPCPEGLFTLALHAIGREPGDYSSKVIVPLAPEMPAAEALRRVLGQLLAAVERNEEGTRQDLDSEFLHDFRVAVRRTRSALGQVREVLPAAAVEPLRRELKWLGDRTGPTRDLDVYRLKMPSYKAALPEAVRQHLAPLESFLRRHQHQEQRRLARTLGSQRYRHLLEAWQRLVAAPDADASAPEAARPVGAVAAERIGRALRRVLKKGSKIHRSTPAAALHRLRIDAKKLRYLLEIFAGAFPPERIQPPVRALKRLQDTLGDFNDFEVQQETLQRFAHQMVAEDLAADPQKGADTLLAMGRLQGQLAAGQARERRRFHRRFEAFAAPRVQRHFAALLEGTEA